MANEQSRADELMLREQNGDAIAATIPKTYLGCMHPFDGSAVTNRQGELVYYFPVECLWSVSARGFGQKKGPSIANSSDYYSYLIEHIACTAQQVGDGQDERSIRFQYVTWTLVPSAADENKYAGFLVRIIYQLAREIPLKFIEERIAKCQEKIQKTVDKGRYRNGPPKYHYLRFTMDKYMDTCEFYSARSIGGVNDRSTAYSMLSSIDNPWNPEKIFTMTHAIRLMINSGAHPDFTSIRNYTDGLQTLFPRNGERTWLIPACKLNPVELNQFYFPHIAHKASDSNPEWINFKRQSGVSADPDGLAPMIEDDDQDPQDNSEEAAKRVYERLAVSSNVDDAFDLDSYKKRVGVLMAEAKKQAGNDRALYFELRRAAQKKSIDMFMSEIFTEDVTADCGDSLRAIAKWFNEYQKSHDNFCMPVPKFSENLSRFADIQAADACAMESVWAINTAHQEIKSIRLAAMHVYYYSPFHVHTCCIGGPGTGKSNAFQVNNSRLIDGTSRDVGSESAKAKNTPGKSNDLIIEFHEDIPPTQLGIQPGGNNAPGSTSNTNEESIIKYRLTKGRMKAVYKQVVNGQHSQVTIESYCNTVMIIGLNSKIHQIPSSIIDRFNPIQFQSKERADALGNNQMFSKYSHGQDRAMNDIKATLVQRDRRNQCFHAIIQLLCFAGVFAMPDMTVPLLIWGHTLSKAREKGLHDTGKIRNYERLVMHCQTLVVEDAIDRVLDSELSPLYVQPDGSPITQRNDPKRKFHAYDLLEFEKHLYANTEHAAFTLGMLQHQYENPSIVSVESYLKNKLLKDKIANNTLGRYDNDPHVAEQLSYYYVVSVTHSVTSNSNDAKSDAATLRDFAKQVHRNMSPQPELCEVVHAIESLSSLEIEVDHKSKPGEKIKIASIAFSKDGEVLIAKAMMDNFEKDRLLTCLKQVLGHADSHEKNLIYGRTKENCPYVWQVIHVMPNPHTKLMIDRPSYMSKPVLEMTQNLVMNVCDSSHEKEPELISADQIENGTFQSKFSDTNHKMVDSDLDDYAATRHRLSMGLDLMPDCVDAPGGSTAAHVMTDAIKKLHHAKPLKAYPMCFPETSRAIYKNEIIKDKATNPEMYSLRSSFKKLKRKRADYNNGADVDDEINLAAVALDDNDDIDVLEIPPDSNHAYYSDNDINNDEDEDEDSVHTPARSIKCQLGSFALRADEAIDQCDFAELDNAVAASRASHSDLLRRAGMGSSNAAASATTASRQSMIAYNAFASHT